ncbi:MAG: hypothetical protein JOZ42_16495 [Acetobacteraceae bacterium]|nr:hypothetical protein [Acetobacteraceae bacterium]
MQTLPAGTVRAAALAVLLCCAAAACTRPADLAYSPLPVPPRASLRR